MNQHPLITTIFTTALCLCLAATTASITGQKFPNEEAAAITSGIANSSSRLLRGRAKPRTDQRQLQDTQVFEETPRVCKSIIAIGGWRLLSSSNDTSSTIGDFSNDPMNTVISYEDEELDEGDEFVDLQYEDGLIALPPGGIEEQPETEREFIVDNFDFSSDDNIIIPYEDKEQKELDTEEEFVCELYDGSTLPIQGTEEQVVELRRLLNNGTLISAESTVEVDPIVSGGVSGSDGQVAGGTSVINLEETVSLPPGEIRLINSDNDSDNKRRRLANNKFEGAKKILIVRVTDKDGKSVDEEADYLSNKFFGTSGDRVTMKSGFDACSFGKFTTTHDYGSEVNKNLLSAPGVVDVRINIKLTESSQATVRDAGVKAVEKKLDVRLPGPFDHVVFVVEACYQIGTSCQFAAYAYVNHWLSLYVGENYKYPAVAMHEIGHNLNLAHSGGTDGRTYTDHTCLMGNPLWEDDVGKMCFNPVKNFQIAKGGDSWYDNQRIANFNSGTDGGTSWSGTLIGVAEYDSNLSNHLIVLKLESGNGADYFVGFNRAIGINSDNVQADNQVTIYKVNAGDGFGYSTSSLKGMLRSGRRMTITNWRQTGLNLVIKVNEINTRVSPGYADVEIAFGPQTTPNPTKFPTRQPTRRPSKPVFAEPPSNKSTCLVAPGVIGFVLISIVSTVYAMTSIL